MDALPGYAPAMLSARERWQYHMSNEVLGVLVARVTGQTFETFLRERIFEPLGMKDTGFYVPEGKIDRPPPAYVPDPQTESSSCGMRRQADATVSRQHSKQAGRTALNRRRL